MHTPRIVCRVPSGDANVNGLPDGIMASHNLQDRLKVSQGQLSDTLNRDLEAFNDMLRRANLPSVVSQVHKPTSQ
jgi:hypothetical protein